MEWSEQLSLSTRGFCAGCIAGIAQNQCAVSNLICTLSAHDIGDQYEKDNPNRMQLFMYEIPSYIVGSACGIHIRHYLPRSWFYYTQRHINPLIVSILGLNLTHEE